MHRWAWGVIVLICAGSVVAMPPSIELTRYDSGTQARLRGISAVDAHVAWASGSAGTVLRTRDGGAHWQRLAMPDEAAALDFRDIEAFDADTAVVLAIGPGEASRIYRTEDGGRRWELVLQNRDPRGFFDCMAFQGDEGWMLGDPVDGRFQVHWTGNAGRDWQLLPHGPQAAEGEAAFAASGSCIALTAGGDVAIATGGAVSRVWVSRLDQATLEHAGPPRTQWIALTTDMPQGQAARGVFSLSGGLDTLIGVGGDYTNETHPSPSLMAFISEITPTLHALPSTRGYRSGVACEAEGRRRCVAVGPSGVDLLEDGRWRPISDAGFDAVSMRGDSVWLSGASGALARFTF